MTTDSTEFNPAESPGPPVEPPDPPLVAYRAALKRYDGGRLVEIHAALALGKERNAAADQHRVDSGPVLVDQTQRGRLGGESRAADRDVALPRLGS